MGGLRALSVPTLLLAAWFCPTGGDAQTSALSPPSVVIPGQTDEASAAPGGEAIDLDQMYPTSVLGPATLPGTTLPGTPLPASGGWGGCGTGCCGGGFRGRTIGGWGGRCGPGQRGCGGGTIGCQACPCGTPHRYWGRLEYIEWFADGMDLPPLVTSSRDPLPPVDEAGVLGAEDTTILFGNHSTLKGWRSGYRLTLGTWLDDCQHLGVEWDYFKPENKSRGFRATSNGINDPILARPFFNINPRDPDTEDFDPPARQDAQLIGYPEIVGGQVEAGASTSLVGSGLRMRYNLCCCQQASCHACGGCTGGSGSRIDFLLGYRYLRLKDRVMVSEELVTFDEEVPISIDVEDRFATRNTFHGVDLGVVWQSDWNRWSCEALGKIALGNNQQRVNVEGSTDRSTQEEEAENNGGLLATQTNIGKRTRDEFAVVPELGVTLGYQLTRRVRATLGYSLIYWSPVVRAGDQIDLDVNPDYLPPVEDPEGPARPRRLFHETDYWVQGFNLGLDARF